MQRNVERERPSDNSKFSTSQTAQEQLHILANMRYTYQPAFGVIGGSLIDYREIVTEGVDTIPGRTRDESLAMLDRAIAFIEKSETMEADDRSRRRIRWACLIVFVVVGLLVVWGIFQNLPNTLV